MRRRSTASWLGTGDVFELNYLGSVVAIVAAIALIVAGEGVGMLTKLSSFG